MGTDQHALAALSAEGLVPDRDLEGDVAALPLRGGGGEGSVDGEGAHGEGIAVAGDDGGDHLLDELGGFDGDGAAHVEGTRNLGGNRDFMEMRQGRVHGGVVALHHGFAALAVSLVNGLLDGGDGFVGGQNAADGEEAGLHDGVDAVAHAGHAGDLIAVDDVELQLLLDDLALDGAREMVPNLVGAVQAVEQENGAGRCRTQHVVALEEGELVAGDKAGLVDEVSRVDRLGAEAQVGNGDGAGLLGVVDEIALGVIVGILADDLDRVLVGADGAIRAEAVEHGAHGFGMLGGEAGVEGQAGMSDVLVDADGEVVLGAGLGQLVEDGLDHGRGEFLGGKTVAAADDLGEGKGDRAGGNGLGDGGDHVAIERLARGAGFLGAVQDGNALHGGGQGGDEVLDGEGAEKADLENAQLRAALVQVLDGLLGGFGSGAHEDEDVLGVGGADVIEELVLAAHLGGELVHDLLHDGGAGVVEGVDGLAGLKEDVGVLRGAAEDGAVGAHGAGAVGADQVVVDHGAQVVLGQLLDFVHFVGGSEAVEEMEEGEARLEGGGVGDDRRVHGFLNGVGSEQGESGLAAGHHVAVVAEDGESVGGHGAGGDVNDAGGEFSGDLEHVGDHQEQALGGGEGGAQRASLQGAMQRARSAAFALHLDDRWDGAPDVRFALGGPFVRPLAHIRGRGNRVDRADFTDVVRRVGRGFIPIDGYCWSGH